MSFEIPWGFHTRAVLHSLAMAKVTQESVSSRIFVRKKGMNRVQSNGRSQ